MASAFFDVLGVFAGVDFDLALSGVFGAAVDVGAGSSSSSTTGVFFSASESVSVVNDESVENAFTRLRVSLSVETGG